MGSCNHLLVQVAFNLLVVQAKVRMLRKNVKQDNWWIITFAVEVCVVNRAKKSVPSGAMQKVKFGLLKVLMTFMFSMDTNSCFKCILLLTSLPTYCLSITKCICRVLRQVSEFFLWINEIVLGFSMYKV